MGVFRPAARFRTMGVVTEDGTLSESGQLYINGSLSCRV
jgi:hypothetical protein